MERVLNVRDLSVRYGDAGGGTHAALAGVSLEIFTGEVLGLAGESGCGKTTLAHALMGILPMKSAERSGLIAFEGRELTSMDARALQRIRGAEISLVSQDPSLALSPVLSVGDQIAEVVHAHKDWSWKRCRSHAKAWIARVGLEPEARFYRSYPHELSGGQLQRVVLAQALTCGPHLLIADEPTAALDARNQLAFVKLLRGLKAEMGLSVLLISHSPEIHASLADRLLVMKEGRIVDEGTVACLYRSATDPYTRKMLCPQATTRCRGSDELMGVQQGPLDDGL